MAICACQILPKNGLLLVVSLALLLFCGHPAAAAEVKFSWPVADQSRAAALYVDQPGATRSGRIAIASHMLAAVEGFAPGDTLILELFDGVVYRVVINTMTLGAERTLSLSGTIQGHRFATFVLTASPESFLVTLEDLERRRVYRVVGDMLSAEGTVLELDRQAMPPVIHLPPLIYEP